MCTSSSTGGLSASGLQEDFAELVYSDPALLMAEFEEIVADEWGRRPPRGEPAGSSSRDPGVHRPPAAALVRDLLRPRHPGLGERARQRSPPPGAGKE